MWRDTFLVVFAVSSAALVLFLTSGGGHARPPLSYKRPVTLHTAQVRGAPLVQVPARQPAPRPVANPPPSSTSLPARREKNGIRLVLDGDTGTRGRLEVAYNTSISWDAWEVHWLKLCGVHFSDEQAQQMCEMLGYSFGRKYYSTEAVYPVRPQGSGTGRTWYSPVQLAYCDTQQARGAPWRGCPLSVLFYEEVASPLTAPYRCCIQYTGPECPDIGPFAAVECADWPFPPAPPPPPMPPSPPPPPVSKKALIRLFGGNTYPYVPVEPNLCVGEARAALCDPSFSRVEVLVADTSGSGQEVWSPVCFPANAVLREQLANLVCKQFHYYPWAQTTPWYSMPGAGPIAFPIPQGSTTPGPGEFNPSSYTTYTSYEGGMDNSTYYLQQTPLKLSPVPCATGLMAVQCWIAEP